MLFSEDWLRSYINPDLTTEELAESLTMAGLEVEEVQKIAPDFTGVVVGHVLECVDHENSDHLHVTKVDVGNGEILQIVCGAPNVRAGLKVACAKIGAVLPEFKIKKAKMRGVESFGMLCSARELGVSSDHTGIWELPADAPVGEDVRKVLHLDDSRFETNSPPTAATRSRWWVSRATWHAVTGAPLTIPAMPAVEATCSCTEPVHIEAPELCGRFTGRVIRGLNAKAPTPQWMKDRLERSGQRSISALVDISNYVMLELGRPTHFFDLKKVKGALTVRWAKDGETIKILNEETVKLDPYYGVICDENGPEAIAGIMGGDATAISDETTDIFIEAAFWYPVKIQGRCRKLNFSTDAAHRFERGVDYGSNVEHMHYITQLVLDICGTAETKVGPVDDQCVNLPKVRTVRMRPRAAISSSASTFRQTSWRRPLRVWGLNLPVTAKTSWSRRPRTALTSRSKKISWKRWRAFTATKSSPTGRPWPVSACAALRKQAAASTRCVWLSPSAAIRNSSTSVSLKRSGKRILRGTTSPSGF